MGKETIIITDILAPKQETSADYGAHNPAKLLGVMLELLKGTWRVPSSAVYTDKIKWDVTGKNVEFYGEWRARDKKDSRTTVWNRIIVQGVQDAKTKEGKVTVRVKPKMQTKLEYATPFDGAVRMMYLNTFYKERIRKYVEVGKKRLNEFDENVRRVLEVQEREEEGTQPAGGV